MRSIIRIYTKLIISSIMILPVIAGCSVHEWPTLPENADLHLKLNYNTEMAKYKYLYDGSKVEEQETADTYDNLCNYGKIRYIVRAYPISDNRSSVHTHEFIFTKDITDGYDHQATISIAPGNYNIMVWSDLVRRDEDTRFYNADNFTQIAMQGNYAGNNDYRDAFRGFSKVSVTSNIMDLAPDTIEIAMQRPLAKFEFISNDVELFIRNQVSSLAQSSQTKSVDIEDYKVVFYYVGFMPGAFNMFEDWPVTQSTDMPFFESSLKALGQSEASMGFDYVFVNGNTSAVSVKIGIYDNTGKELSMSNIIDIPLKRDQHTVITGKFLTLKASGGITVNPDYNGDHNFIFPYQPQVNKI